MAIIKVKYTKAFEQTIDWPEDEMESFTYDSLLCNLDIDKSIEQAEDEIIYLWKDGIEYDF